MPDIPPNLSISCVLRRAGPFNNTDGTLLDSAPREAPDCTVVRRSHDNVKHSRRRPQIAEPEPGRERVARIQHVLMEGRDPG